MNYYKTPLNFKKFFEEDSHSLDKCGELSSIDQTLELLLTTCSGEHRFDREFGSQIWKLDFERIESRSQCESIVRQYVYDAIGRHEPRLSDVVVSVSVNDYLEKDRLADRLAARKRADILIRATLKPGGQKCKFGYTLYLGPLTNE